MRTYLLVSLLLTLLNISCELSSSDSTLKDTNWKFVSLSYDRNYSWDTFEVFTSQKIRRLNFTDDSLFVIKNDSKVFSSRYSVRSDTIILLTSNHGNSLNKVLIQKLSKDTLILYDTLGVTFRFSRESN